MKRVLSIGLLGAFGLAGCGGQVHVAGPQGLNLAKDVVQITGEGPPAGPEGTCWAHERQPAVYETVTEQSLVSPEVRDGAGNVIAPAVYRSISKLSQVQENRDIWFKSPCPETVTVDFLATLQRALKARGYYLMPVTGAMDAATAEALRRYQADHGLDSPQLSLAAAQDLGLATTALNEL